MTIEDKVARLLKAGCENLYPKFIVGVGDDRVVAAEVYNGELLVYPHGEALIEATKTKARAPKTAAAADEAPAEVVEGDEA